MVFVHNLNPTILKFSFLEIRWYGVMYVIAFFLVYYYVKRQMFYGKTNLSTEQLDDLLVWSVIGLLLGSRLFNMFYYPAHYLSRPWEFFYIWQGGMSYFGGLFGLAVAVFLFSKINKIDFLHVTDLMVVPLSLGQALGRLGNFINGELWGKITNLSWGVVFPQAGPEPRHPTQIYQFILGVIIFIVLYMYKDKFTKGKLLALYLMMYGFMRFFIEFLLEDPVMSLSFLGLSQWFSIIAFVVGIIMWKKLN